MMGANRIKRWLRRGLPLVLSFLLAIEMGVAFMPHAASAAEGNALQICTDDGVQTVVIDPVTGKPISSKPMPDRHCPLCVVGAALIVDEPSIVLVNFRFERVRIAIAKIIPRLDDPVRTGPIRAPPQTV